MTIATNRPLRVRLDGDAQAWRRRIAVRGFIAYHFGRRVSLVITSASHRSSPAAICAAISSWPALSAWCMILAATSSAGDGACSAAGPMSTKARAFSSITIFRAIMRWAGWDVRVGVSTERPRATEVVL
jgi:hypothetical protein